MEREAKESGQRDFYIAYPRQRVVHVSLLFAAALRA
jgi:hypothetical protein